MEKQLVENYYLDIKTIIGSALIGVVSFQLLGPVVWEYLQANLGVPFKFAFRLFIFGYFLLIPAGFIFWLVYHYDIVKTIIPPFDESKDLSKDGRIFLYILLFVFVSNIIAHIIITFLDISIACSLIYLFIPYILLTSVLLLMSYRFGNNLVLHNGLDKNKEWKRGYGKSKLFSLIAYVVIVACGLGFVLKGGKTAATTNPISKGYDTDLTTATSLLDNKSKIDNSNLKIAYLKQYLSVLSSDNNKNGAQDSIQLASEIKNGNAFDTLHNSLFGQSMDLSGYIGNLNFLINILKIESDSLSKIEDCKKEQEKADNPKSESLRDKVDISILKLESTINEATMALNYKSIQLIDYYLYNIKNSQKNISTISPVLADTNSIKMVNDISQLLLNNSGQIRKITQKFLGPNLRNLQEWGVVMFLFLLLTMLSLHHFIKLNFEIASWQLKDEAEKHELNKDLDKAPLIAKAKYAARLEDPSKKLWLIITAGLWLFIPLIKPIEDEQINVDSPFRQITPLNKTVNDLPVLKEKASLKDTVYQSFLMVKKDSVFINSPSNMGGTDSSLTGQLNRMETQMKEMNEAIKDAKEKIEKING